jgi:hypothetical protein
VLVVLTPGYALRTTTAPPSATPAAHLDERIFDLAQGARVCGAQLGLEGVVDGLRDRCSPQLFSMRERHVDDRHVATEPGPVLPEVVENGVVGQHAAEHRQALVQVVQVVDKGSHLLISHGIPTCLGGLPCGASRDGGERGCRCLNDEGPIDCRHHVRSMTFGRSEGKGEADLTPSAHSIGRTSSDVQERLSRESNSSTYANAGPMPDPDPIANELAARVGPAPVLSPKKPRDLDVRHARFTDLTFEVYPGRVTGFLGPNGSGKSTTTRVMLQLDHADTGQTLFDGQRYADIQYPTKKVGSLLEAHAVHPKVTARNHLRVLAAANRIPETRIDHVFGQVGLADAADRRTRGSPSACSSGSAWRRRCWAIRKP